MRVHVCLHGHTCMHAAVSASWVQVGLHVGLVLGQFLTCCLNSVVTVLSHVCDFQKILYQEDLKLAPLRRGRRGSGDKYS